MIQIHLIYNSRNLSKALDASKEANLLNIYNSRNLSKALDAKYISDSDSIYNSRNLSKALDPIQPKPQVQSTTVEI